jgi:hypothetical protein
VEERLPRKLAAILYADVVDALSVLPKSRTILNSTPTQGAMTAKPSCGHTHDQQGRTSDRNSLSRVLKTVSVRRTSKILPDDPANLANVQPVCKLLANGIAVTLPIHAT